MLWINGQSAKLNWKDFRFESSITVQYLQRAASGFTVQYKRVEHPSEAKLNYCQNTDRKVNQISEI